MEKQIGCYGCKWLEYFDGDIYSGEPEPGWGCNKRDDSILEKRIKEDNFPFRRKPKCFEVGGI
jgi:hypothetical protein